MKPERFKREDFGKYFTKLGLTDYGAEVGVRTGDFSLDILKKWKGKHLFLIDSWVKYPEMTVSTKIHLDNMMIVARLASKIASPDRISIMRISSEMASSIFRPKSLDWVYIDAAHNEDSVLSDLFSWWDIIKRPGILCGHDWQIPSVRHAVELFADDALKIHVTLPSVGTSWYIFKE